MSDTNVAEPPAGSVVTAAPVKETKAQKAERLKLEKNPWEAWDEVREFARPRTRQHSGGVGDVLPVVGDLLAG